MRTILLTLLLVVLAPLPAGAAERRVAIEATGFDPAVAVVAPGTEVVWRNADASPRRILGAFARSPLLAPGEEFRHVFRRPGEYPYRDPDREAVEGTIVVALGGGAVRRAWGPRPRRPVVHRYAATMTFALRESSRYRDGKWQSFEGPCNAQVGRTSRTVRWSVRLRDAEYTLLPPFESFTTASTPVRMGVFRELVDAKAQDSLGAPVTCPDGGVETSATVPVTCQRRLDGSRMRMSLAWNANVAQGRFQFTNDGPAPSPPDPCGLSYVHTGSLVGIRGFGLPLNLVGTHFVVDGGNTSPATAAEVRALRAGRPLTIVREIHLRYTTDCCSEWHSGQVPGIYVRVGEVREAFAKLTIRLTPR